MSVGVGARPRSGPGIAKRLRFRAAALPIIIGVSDARFHNGKYPGEPLAPGTYHDPYQTFASAMPNIDTLVSAINNANARFIGVATSDRSSSMGGCFGLNPPCDSDGYIRSATSVRSAYGDMAYLTDNTNSNIPALAFGAGSTECRTGIAAYGVSSPEVDTRRV